MQSGGTNKLSDRSQQPPSLQAGTPNETARYLAQQVIRGFHAHDEGFHEEAVEAFFEVDRVQFAHLDDEKAKLASTAYVDALFEKDDVELNYLRDGSIDRAGLRDADWGPVRNQFRIRAGIVGMDPEYAVATTEGWKSHKTGDDYWTPIQRAQMYELRAALQDPDYPRKPKHGQSGFGPEPARYALAIELHDMHAWQYVEQAVDVMVPYFERIVTAHRDETAESPHGTI